MKEVNIAKLKSMLSHYLRLVRAGGEVLIKDRDTPVARLVPYGRQRGRLTIQPAAYAPRTLAALRIPAAPPGLDSLAALLEDRRDDLDELT